MFLFQSNKTITTVQETENGETENVNITNLTAEIESFVRTADTDKETIIATRQDESTELRIDESKNVVKMETNEVNMENGINGKNKTSRQSPESNDFYPQDENGEELTIEKIENLGAIDVDVKNNSERVKRSPIKIFVRAPTDEESMDSTEKEPTPIVDNEMDFETKDTEQETILVEQVCIEKESTPNNVIKRNEIAAITVIPEEEENNQTNNSDKSQTTPTSSSVEFILENQHENGIEPSNEVTDLRITESTDDLTKITELKPENEITIKPVESIDATNETKENQTDTSIERFIVKQYEVRTVPLKINSPVLTRRKTFEEETTSNESPTLPSKRRSVKEIIESINKCQGLLKINQDHKINTNDNEQINSNLFNASSSTSKTNNKNTFVDRNMNDLTGKQYGEKKMFSDFTEVNNNNARHNDGFNNIPLFVEKFNELNKNDPTSFERCTIRNSKRTDDDEKISNVAWNPVPKPRRHRNSKQTTIN